MSTVRKCARCGLQSSSAINQHVVCSACGTGFQLCERCVPTWKVNKCPSCGMGPANAKWQVMGGSSSSSSSASLSHVGAAKSGSELYDNRAERRKEKRNEEGAGQHQGASLPPEHVSVLREIEDAIKAEIVPQKTDGNKANTFVQRDGNVVELYLAPEYQSSKIPLIDMIAKLTTLEGLGIRGFSVNASLAPLDGLANFKKLAFQSKPRAEYPMVVSGDMIAGICSISKLEELNIASVEVDPAALDQNITRLKNLKKLNISGLKSPKYDQITKNIGQVSSLEELAISHIRVSSRPAIPPGIENLPNIKIVHMDYEQNELLGSGKIKAKLEQNNPAVYPKKDLKAKGLGFLKGLASGGQTMTDKAKAYQDSMPEVLKKGFSGIMF